MTAIADDGEGMDEAALIQAMRLGSSNPRSERHHADLGRFGLGLKTASFSQARRVTVTTKQSGGTTLTRVWDIDHVAETNEWRLLRTASSSAQKLINKLLPPKHGTVVVWEKLDRLGLSKNATEDIQQNQFLARAEEVGAHFSMVFHRMMTGKPKVEFRLNGNLLLPWDPFLSDQPATQPLPKEKLMLSGNEIEIEPYVLPHLSKIGPEQHKAAAGVKGWNAHQGFYIYRNKRLLVSGDWLGIKGWRQEEHYKLARIIVDLPNSLDHEWEIDVTKSRARPPESLRPDLARIGERTRSAAKSVYTHRGAKLTSETNKERLFIWNQIVKKSQVSYRINREHPLLIQFRSCCTDLGLLSSLLRLVEETVPIPLITITDREKPDQTIGPFETVRPKELLDLMRKIHDSLLKSGLSRKDALLMLSRMEPFPNYPDLLECIDEPD